MDILSELVIIQQEAETLNNITPENNPFVPFLQKALVAEFQQWDVYHNYKTQLQGLSRDPIAQHFEEHAKEEAEHIDILQRHLVGMGVVPTTERLPIPQVTCPSIQAIVAMQLEIELAAVDVYEQILTLMADSPTALRVDIETILSQEQEHSHDLQFLLRGYDDPATRVALEHRQFTKQDIRHWMKDLLKEAPPGFDEGDFKRWVSEEVFEEDIELDRLSQAERNNLIKQYLQEEKKPPRKRKVRKRRRNKLQRNM